MIHVAMLREKQVEVIEAFKTRYRQRFGDKLPVFIPTAVIMAVQPLQQDYNFTGFFAPIIQFQRAQIEQPGVIELSAPQVYSVLDFTQATSQEITWQGSFKIERDGTVNALRFITKNILAIDQAKASSIDWLIDYLVLPLQQAIEVKANDTLQVSFSHRTGGSIRSLENNILASLSAS
jgi:predicted RNA methylase